MTSNTGWLRMLVIAWRAFCPAAGDDIEGWDLGAPAEMWPEAEPASRIR